MSAALNDSPRFGLWHEHPLYLHYATCFAVLVAAACAIIGWNNYVQGRQLKVAAAAYEFERMRKESAEQIDRMHAPAEALVEWMSVAPLARATTLEARLESLSSMAAFLKMQPHLTAIYMGYSNGDFFLVRPMRNDADRLIFKLPPAAAYLMQSIERGKNLTRFISYDGQLNRLTDTTPTDYQFDPRTRPWYIKAHQKAHVARTAPYVFFGTGNIGLTVAQRAKTGAVAGVDATLVAISAALARARTTPSSQLVIFDANQRAIAFSDHQRLLLADNGEAREMPLVAELSPLFSQAAQRPADFAASQSLHIGPREWMVRVASLKGDDTGSHFAVAVPYDELLVEARAQLQRNLWVTLAVVLLTVFAAWLISRRIARNLGTLSEQVAAIRRFDFGGAASVKSPISEIFHLTQAMQQMKDTIGKFLDIGKSLSEEPDTERLLQRVLTETCQAVDGEGAALYLLDEDGQTLRPVAQHWQRGAALTLSNIATAHAAHPLVQALRPGATAEIYTLRVPYPAEFTFIESHFGATGALILTLPMRRRSGALLGMLCVFYGEGSPTPAPERLALAEAFLGSGALAINNRRLLQAQKGLLDSFIALLARAIDAKSPYTYGHCQRVPELTEMLARAACETKEGPFAQFNLSEEQWEALHVAGWLHDCGKVTTPEYVVDKATKLETIHDRIHLVRMRFEIIKCAAEIACLKKIAAGTDKAQAHAELHALWRTLDEEFAFIATCNEGGEFMAPDKIAKLNAIAQRTWRRTLDDRLGVSREEAERMGEILAQPLPVTEQLLADKPEHIIERREPERIPENNRWGFRLRVPQHKYNRGELYNLSISRGTLTAEERYMINDHIVQTIVMLTELPFPSHLKLVAEIAGGHHEKMDGTGYPKRLRREDMSVQARIMAIADIFEALTAADRPYKKGKTLSEALKIMGSMKRTHHIDPELFDLFLQSGVYRQFAEKYLSPESMDAVNIDDYLGTPVAT